MARRKSAKRRKPKVKNLAPKVFDCPSCGTRESCKVLLKNKFKQHEVNCWNCKLSWQSNDYFPIYETLDVWADFCDSFADEIDMKRALEYGERNEIYNQQQVKPVPHVKEIHSEYLVPNDFENDSEDDEENDFAQDDEFMSYNREVKRRNISTVKSEEESSDRLPFHRSSNAVDRIDGHHNPTTSLDKIEKVGDKSIELLDHEDEERLDLTSEEAEKSLPDDIASMADNTSFYEDLETYQEEAKSDVELTASQIVSTEAEEEESENLKDDVIHQDIITPSLL